MICYEKIRKSCDKFLRRKALVGPNLFATVLSRNHSFENVYFIVHILRNEPANWMKLQ